MKKKNFLAIACALLLGSVSTPLRAQESGNWSMAVGADAVSSFLWRGMESGGPSIQPSVYFDYENGDWAVSIGSWGSKSVYKNRYGVYYDELDFSAEASWRNLTLSLANYNEFYGEGFDGAYLDLGLSYTLSEKVPLTVSWYSILDNKMPSYFELSYDFSISVVDFSVAAGCWPFKSWYYGNGGFNVCNLNLSAGHEFELRDDMVLPVSAQIMYNPSWNEFFWGVSVGYYFSLDF